MAAGIGSVMLERGPGTAELEGSLRRAASARGTAAAGAAIAISADAATRRISLFMSFHCIYL
jgi:hypothetical protein